MNTELFAKIRDIIRENPEQHDQGTFESGLCGTTRCVAGWAIRLEAGAPLFTANFGCYLTPEVRALGERLGVEREEYDDDLDLVPVIAQKLLGLSDQEAHQLFYLASNQAALELVEQYAEGE